MLCSTASISVRSRYSIGTSRAPRLYGSAITRCSVPRASGMRVARKRAKTWMAPSLALRVAMPLPRSASR